MLSMTAGIRALSFIILCASLVATLVLWRLLDHSYQQQACVAFKETTP